MALAGCYFRRKRFYTEHLVFALHVQTVAFLVLTLVQILPDFGPGVWVRLGLFLAPYAYFLIALRRYYQDGWVWTVAKSIGVGFLYFLALGPAVTIVVLARG